MTSTTSRPSLLGRATLVACATIGVAALAIVLVALPDGAPTSSDPGAPAVPWWVVLLPAAVGVALTLVVPRRPAAMPAVVADARRHRASTAALVACAVAFPLVVGLLELGGGEGYVLAKLVLLMLVPAVAVATLRGVRIAWARGRWRWWAPAVVVGVWVLLSQVAPWNPAHDLSGIDPTLLVVSATATAITAGLGEELFYRRWLQTRLEAGLGAWPGIALTSLAFALMHLGSHAAGEPVLDVARVVVSQGSFGLLMGVLWWRYRNLVAIVVAHLVVNGWDVAAHLLA